MHENFLALVQQRADVAFAVLFQRQLCSVLCEVHIARMEKARSRQANFNECCLHTRQDAHHAALVDVAGDAVAARALQMNFLNNTRQQQRDPRLEAVHIDEDFLDHADSLRFIHMRNA